jgi:hypothetical protein
MFSILTLTFIFVRAVYAQWPAPDPCSGFCHSHDPSVIKHENGTYFRFSSGNTVATSLSLTGPWVHEPDALVGASAGVRFSPVKPPNLSSFSWISPLVGAKCYSNRTDILPILPIYGDWRASVFQHQCRHLSFYANQLLDCPWESLHSCFTKL